LLEINPSTSRQWSRIGSRGMYGQAILDLAERRADLMVLSADLANSSGLDRFKNAFPDQFVNVGIAEQNLIGVAAGLAKEGHTVFASSFAPFITMRASEQVRMNLGYMQMNVKAVGIGSGLVMGFLGNSHFGIEDAAVMRAIPGITVVTPADCAEIVKVVNAAANYVGPMYIRLTGGPNSPIVYSEEYEFTLGKAIKLRDGNDVAIITNGSMVAKSISAANLLDSQGISTAVFNFHTIKPLDLECLTDIASQYRKVVIVEEHSVIGGLGGAIAEYWITAKNPPLVRILGLPDEFGKTGEYEFLLKRYGLTADGISASVRELTAFAHDVN
jgi:transketolase